MERATQITKLALNLFRTSTLTEKLKNILNQCYISDDSTFYGYKRKKINTPPDYAVERTLAVCNYVTFLDGASLVFR